ncbi:unnamed protein product [Caenorhabditis angaria]|uniref:Guanylate cyclase n=1 Tax=Caenorhabditis angaria TaxID=860376 RepID=A0A9P1IUQ8_9PELO|nr:unnamed protein product [Caenorhabditis angaria]
MILIWIFCNFLIDKFICQTNTLQVGLLFVENLTDYLVAVGYRTSASAILIGEERIRKDHLLDNYKFNYSYAFDECSESLGAGKMVEMIENNNIDVLFGPTCNRPAQATAAIGAYYNIPVFVWGLTTAVELSDTNRYPTTVTFSVNSYSLAESIHELMNQFGWSQFVFVYSNDGDEEKCESLKNDVQTVISVYNDVQLAYLYQIGTVTLSSLRTAIQSIKTRGRIIVACFAANKGLKKAFMQAAYLEEAVNNEYVYIMAETNSRGFRVDDLGGEWHYIWDGNSGIQSNWTVDQARDAFENVWFLIDNAGMLMEVTDEFKNFSSQVILQMKNTPFNCTADCANSTFQSVSSYAGQLADAFYAYAKALNQTLARYPDAGFNNGSLIVDNIGMTFVGVGGGDVTIGSDLSRTSEIYLMCLNQTKLPQAYAKITVESSGTTYLPYYASVNDFWEGDSPALAVPLCGFSGDECPTNFIQDYLVYTIIVALIIFLSILAAVFGILYTLWIRKKELEKQDHMWHVSFVELQKIVKKSNTDYSQRSFASGPSTATKATVESRVETTRFAFYTYKLETVAAMKHEIRVQFNVEEKFELRRLRSLDHVNLNRFIGLCLDGPQLLSIWKFCSRGSLADVIAKSSMQMDSFFIFSLIRDIADALGFIHGSHLNHHGCLTSQCCLIDDRWQIKVSDYGLKFIKRFENDKKSSKMLWMAPELLRSDFAESNQESDIYSFAIICSELMTRTSAFDIENRKEKVEEVIYQVKKGGMNPMRPSLDIDETMEMNPALLHLVRDCWTERPSERPTIIQIKSLLKSMNNGKKSNLMDHVFNMLETYASTLEEEVSERTKELVEEKKKSDVLLYRMLPRTVAEKLKLGQAVEPETFEQVTIFFSDVVKFTNLAAKCSPFQVVTLLNDLYTIFDNIIEQNDVYKVETIGDGYLCVSGLPHRNGNDHIRHISRMALGFLSSLEFFRIPHLPSERINLRIGINCGSVVAGVVGLTMPRYCLFGDAVNTASRMESNGKPGRIHLSGEANRMLTQVVGGFETESRGEVIIKGKGVMETFWLTSENTEHSQSILKEQPKTVESRSITPDN